MAKIKTLTAQLEKIRKDFKKEITKAQTELLAILREYKEIAPLNANETDLIAILEKEEDVYINWETESD